MRKFGFVLMLVAGLSGACSGGSSTTSPSASPSGSAGPSASLPVTSGSPVQAPKPGETLDQVIAKVTHAITAKTCDAYNALLLSSFTRNDASCEYVRKGLDGAKDPKGKLYGTGAEVDYLKPNSSYGSLVMVLEADRTYRVVDIDTSDSTGPNVQTAANGAGWDTNVAKAVDALRKQDCNALIAVANRTFGVGAGDKTTVCNRMAGSAFAKALQADPSAKPVGMGGNNAFSFYGISTKDGYYTLLMAQQTSSTTAAAGARYSYVGAYKV